jgi:hypothetical protein
MPRMARVVPHFPIMSPIAVTGARVRFSARAIISTIWGGWGPSAFRATFRATFRARSVKAPFFEEQTHNRNDAL